MNPMNRLTRILLDLAHAIETRTRSCRNRCELCGNHDFRGHCKFACRWCSYGDDDCPGGWNP